MTKEQRYRINAVYQAGQVLKTIANNKEPMGPSDLARAMGITNDTAFRMCITLEEIGFLTQVGDKYDLGMGLALFWARKKSMLETQKERIQRDIDDLEITE